MLKPATNGRGARRGGRGWRALGPVGLGVLLGSALALPVGAQVGQRFQDVPPTNFAVRAIEAIAAAGITTGIPCGTPGAGPCVAPENKPYYGPDAPVTRAQMAAFMLRGFGRASFDPVVSAHNPLRADATVDLADVRIKPGEVPSGTVFVRVDGVATAEIQNPNGCPCEAGFQFRQLTDGVRSPPQYTTLIAPTGAAIGGGSAVGSGSVALTWVFTASAGVTETYRLVSNITGYTGAVPEMVGYGTISAQYVPFGPAGNSPASVPTPLGGAPSPMAGGSGALPDNTPIRRAR